MKSHFYPLVMLLLSTQAWAGYDRISVVHIDSKLSNPFGVAFDADRNLYVVEHTHRLVQVDRAGKLTVVAGKEQPGLSGDGELAEKAQLNSPHSIAIGPGGDVYVADTNNCRVRRIDGKSRIISNFAGTGKKGFGGDGGLAAEAQFGNVYCVAFDPKFERMFLADLDNRRIRAIDMKTGVVSTVAGNGKKGVPKDGEDAKDQPLVDPRAVAADSKGNVYVLERSGHALRMVDSAGKIKTVAGTGKAGYSGDGGPALAAAMNGPKHLCIERNDSVLIADTENHVIRRYQPADGKIELVAGTGKKGSSGAGSHAIECQLSRPHGVFVRQERSLFTTSDKIYIADSDNNRVLEIEFIASP